MWCEQLRSSSDWNSQWQVATGHFSWGRLLNSSRSDEYTTNIVRTHTGDLRFATPLKSQFGANMRNDRTSTLSTVTTTTITQYTSVTKRGKRELIIRTTFLPPPSTLPVYASACPNTLAYLSACSCWNISPVTIILPTPTYTDTVYTSTSTVYVDLGYTARV